MTTPGTPENPLRVAIVGSGPSGFYAAQFLLAADHVTVEVEMFDRLPTPFGLVRGGVAPDHQKIKSVTKAYDKIAAASGFRFHGNIELGRDVSREDLLEHHHAVIYAVGASSERRLGLEGENLPGSYAAADFVGWYNAHPDFTDLEVDVAHFGAAVVGNGNVAIDVARTLASVPERLREGDMADHAIGVLDESAVRRIYLLGRRGPAQAAFTTKELRELTEMPDVDVIVDPADLELGELTERWIADTPDGPRDRNLALMREIASTPLSGAERQIIFRFLVSPTEILGDDIVTGLEIGHNTLAADDAGTPRPQMGDAREVLDVGLVFRAIGYLGEPLEGLPFDDWTGTIPNEAGRVVDGDDVIAREYVAGWIKRGPSGVVGTNKPDSQETVSSLFDDHAGGVFDAITPSGRSSLDAVLAGRGRPVSFDDWGVIDGHEQQRGAEHDRIRRKFSRVEEMLRTLPEDHEPT